MTRLSLTIVGTAAAAAVLPIPSAAVERWYSTGLYPVLQRTLTPLSNLVPFALFDALCVAAIATAAVAVYRQVSAAGWMHGLARALRGLVVAAAIVYLVFLVTWGLNYRRVPLPRKLVFEPAQVTRASAAALGDANAATLNRLYAASHPARLSVPSLAASFEATLRALGGAAPIVPGRPKQTLLGGYFHQISVAGMTDPFFLETLVAPDLIDAERPFVLAHEWGHLAGYADESEANYVAWLTCRHGDALAQYSAALTLLGYAEPSRPLRDALDLGPKIDLTAIRERYRMTNETLRLAAQRGYDTYLKANRVEEGVLSYDAVVQLILGTTLDDRGYPTRR
jgi:hypothetical protein